MAAIKTKARNYFCCPAGEVSPCVCVCVLCRYGLDFPRDIVILAAAAAAAACGCHYRSEGVVATTTAARYYLRTRRIRKLIRSGTVNEG